VDHFLVVLLLILRGLMLPPEHDRRQGGMGLGERGEELRSPSRCLLQDPFRRTRRSTGELMAVWHTFAEHHDCDNGMIDHCSTMSPEESKGDYRDFIGDCHQFYKQKRCHKNVLQV
jgi:hypothetical protein